MRLRTTLVGMLVVVALVLSGTIYAGFSTHREDVLAQERGNVERTATVVADRIDTRLDTTTDVVDLWAANEALLADNSTSRSTALGTFVNRTTFSSAGVYARNGTLRSIAGSGLTASDVDLLEDTNYSGDPFMAQALSGFIYVSDPQQTMTDRYVVRIAAPIHDSDGEIAAVLSGNFNLRERSLFRDISVAGGDSDRVRISDNGRELFAELPHEGEVITANATVERTGWTISVQRPQSTIAGQLGLATAMQVGGVLVGLIVVGFVGLWISRTTVSRIRTLLGALTDLEAGEYRTDLELGTIEEWQQISRRFNSLAATLKQRDSQLRVLNRVLRHNLRNDMNVITARAERVLADEDTSDRIEADVEQIHATATRLIDTSEHARTLYDDLLTSPKQETEPVDAVAVVEERASKLAAHFPEATIETDGPAQAWALDSAVLPIVVEEVLHNALAHNDRPESDRRVTVTVETDAEPTDELATERETRIAIGDNGPGMPMVEEALLTNQLEETAIEHGSGLGVWLVNWLVDRIDGTVSVSTGPDRGTTVILHLPAPAHAPADESEADDLT